jgi:hypothetical protein
VREHALRFLACLAVHAAAAPGNIGAAKCASRKAGAQGVRKSIVAPAEQDESGGSLAALAEIFRVCSSRDVMVDVLAALAVNSAMVAAAAGKAPLRIWHSCMSIIELDRVSPSIDILVG